MGNYRVLTLLLLATGCSTSGLRTPVTKSPTLPHFKTGRFQTGSLQTPHLNTSGRLALSWPLETGRLSRGFKPRTGGRRPHLGLDLVAPRGTKIHAAHGGLVIYAGREFTGFGKLVIIENGDWATFYSHCSRIHVREGEIVQQGDVVAAVGATGRATGPHLHFELRFKEDPLDPLPYLDNAMYPSELTRAPAGRHGVADRRK